MRSCKQKLLKKIISEAAMHERVLELDPQTVDNGRRHLGEPIKKNAKNNKNEAFCKPILKGTKKIIKKNIL